MRMPASDLHGGQTCDKHLPYTRRQLLSLYSRTLPLSSAVEAAIRSAGLRSVCRLRSVRHCTRLCRYRNCRSGRSQRLLPTTRDVGNGAVVVVGSRRAARVDAKRPPSVIRVHVNRHTTCAGRQLVFACHNIRSVANKLDDLLEVCRDLSVDVCFLVETWHDADSVAFRRLRADGFQVADRPRPRTRVDTLKTNHGGVATVANSGIRLTTLDPGIKPSTFELLVVRVVSGSTSCVVVVIYRTGVVTSSFFSELSDVMERVVTNVDPVYIVGDINIRLDRTDDASARQFTDVLDMYGFSCRVSSPTHDLGGLLDVVASRNDLPTTAVDVIDVGLSDHRLLRWSASLARPRPVYTTTTRRPWRQLDVESFRCRLLSSSLCRPDT